MTAWVPLLLAALASTSVAPKAEVRNVRISSPKILVSREKAESEVLVCGQVRVEMSFAGKTAHKPVLRLTCLSEVDGALSVNTVFLDRPRTCEAMGRAAIQAAYKDAGIEILPKDRESALVDPARFTPCLPEVAKEAYVSAVYGTADMKRGFFRLGRAQTLPKVLLYRIELWQNGVLVAAHDSSRTGLGSYEIPADWHQWKKHPQKFKYHAYPDF